MRRLLPLLLLALLLAPARAAEAPATPEAEPPPVVVTGLRVEIVERGIYEADPGVTREMPNGIGESTLDAVRLVRSTTAIPARPGLSFGLEFLVHGRPPGTLVELTTTVVFPPQGLVPPSTGRAVGASTMPMTVSIGEGSVIYRGYSFDYEWEVAPGPWRFEIRAGDRLLAVQSFIITQESGFRR